MGHNETQPPTSAGRGFHRPLQRWRMRDSQRTFVSEPASALRDVRGAVRVLNTPPKHSTIRPVAREAQTPHSNNRSPGEPVPPLWAAWGAGPARVFRKTESITTASPERAFGEDASDRREALLAVSFPWAKGSRGNEACLSASQHLSNGLLYQTL